MKIKKTLMPCFVSIAAWASYQRSAEEIPCWRAESNDLEASVEPSGMQIQEKCRKKYGGIRSYEGEGILGLFDKLKKKKEAAGGSNAYMAAPKFYEKQDGVPFGAIALTEGTATVLPENPLH